MIKLQTIALALAVVAFDAAACSCSSTPLSEKVEAASFVGVVRVESTRLRPNLLELLKGGENADEARNAILADFTPVAVLKGDVREVTLLTSGFGGGDCGVSLIPGFDYLVIGYPHSGELEVGLCSGSEPLGIQSLAASLPGAEDWERDDRLVDAVRRQLEDGVMVPACLDNNPRFSMGLDECETPDSDAKELDRHP